MSSRWYLPSDKFNKRVEGKSDPLTAKDRATLARNQASVIKAEAKSASQYNTRDGKPASR